MYDIFYACKEKNQTYFDLKKRFPLLRIAKYTDKFTEAVFDAQRKSFTDMFWIIDEDYQIADDFNFDYEVLEWETHCIHVFKNIDNSYDGGLNLIPKNYTFEDKELEYGFFINTTEVEQVAGQYQSEEKKSVYERYGQPFDIFFISYNEPNADENYEKLKERFPYAQRIHGVKGIHNAHIAAAKLSERRMFWIVDGDAIIDDDFNFETDVPEWSANAVYVFRSKNPVNDLVYGYGGVKFLPKNMVLAMDTNTVDMTTSISKRFKSMPKVSNITSFNTDPFNTWKSAFRECVKLSSKVINGQIDNETQNRLDVWCTVGADRPFGEYCVKGAITGKEFGLTYSQDKDMLKNINDWEWLTNKFEENIK